MNLPLIYDDESHSYVGPIDRRRRRVRRWLMLGAFAFAFLAAVTL